MEQWNERRHVLEAKLNEIRMKPGNLLTGMVFNLSKSRETFTKLR